MIEQGVILKVKEQVAVVQVDGAHRAHHVIDDALFGVDEAGGILVDLDPAPSSTG